MKLKFGKVNTLSNYISLFRLLLSVPVYFLLDNLHYSAHIRIYLIIAFFLAYVSDILDGYIARKTNQISEVGKIIDPLADKVLVILIVTKLFLMGEIPAYFFWIIVLRDVLIFTGGIFVTRKIGKVIPSNILGKVTVASIALFLLAVVLNVRETKVLYYLLMYISITLSVASVIGYAIRANKSIKTGKI